MKERSNQVRIIAGQWRGRKLTFPDEPGLRPTADRIRETLFNWLASRLPGAHCLDLFAGSGALGFESASRGAMRVVMVENNTQVVRLLKETRQRFADTVVAIEHADVLGYLARVEESFDIVFLDPPFDNSELRERSLALLAQSGCLKPGGYVYLEAPKQEAEPVVTADWSLLKRKTAGQVAYRLYRNEDQSTG